MKNSDCFISHRKPENSHCKWKRQMHILKFDVILWTWNTAGQWFSHLDLLLPTYPLSKCVCRCRSTRTVKGANAQRVNGKSFLVRLLCFSLAIQWASLYNTWMFTVQNEWRWWQTYLLAGGGQWGWEMLLSSGKGDFRDTKRLWAKNWIKRSNWNQ